MMNECFICCTDSGKNEQERITDMYLQRRSLSYPLISLSHAYDCQCHTAFAHNCCLQSVMTCPTCRKPTSCPKLRVRSRWELVVPSEWIRTNIQLFTYIQHVVAAVFFVALAVICLHDHKIIVVSHMQCWVALGVANAATLVVVLLDDFMRKYWLYNPKTKTFY